MTFLLYKPFILFKTTTREDHLNILTVRRADYLQIYTRANCLTQIYIYLYIYLSKTVFYQQRKRDATKPNLTIYRMILRYAEP